MYNYSFFDYLKISFLQKCQGRLLFIVRISSIFNLYYISLCTVKLKFYQNLLEIWLKKLGNIILLFIFFILNFYSSETVSSITNYYIILKYRQLNTFVNRKNHYKSIKESVKTIWKEFNSREIPCLLCYLCVSVHMFLGKYASHVSAS